MSCVMRCPACMEEVKREKWSKAQWKNSDPWREGRKCCTVCQKTDTDGRNTWHTDGKLHMRQDKYRAYARVLREGWEQPQQRSRESKSKQFCVESRRNPGCVPAAAYASVVVTHFLTCRGLREFRSRGADHPMFARLRPHSSGSAQFCGILGERLFAPVSDEKKA